MSTSLEAVSRNATSSLPPGLIVHHGGSTAPTGYLLCNGGSYSTSTYPGLFGVIGYTFGGSGGSFSVPNIQGYVIGGYNSGDGNFNSIGANGTGQKTVSLSVNSMPGHSHGVSDPQGGHGHSVYDPGHSHAINWSTYTAYKGQGGTTIFQNFQNNTNYTIGQSMNTSGLNYTILQAQAGVSCQQAGSGNAHNNLMPYLVVQFMIKT